MKKMNLNINDYSGPLDVLLQMIKKHEVDIYTVDLKIIIDEYIAFINTLEESDLDTKSEYLIMASELIHLKSKLLLGFDDEEDTSFEINSEEDLRNRIIEFEKYQNISNDFRVLESKRKDFFTKIPESMSQYTKDEKIINNELDVNDLLSAFNEMLKRYEYSKPRETKVTRKEISLNEKTSYIRSILEKEKKVEFTSLFSDFTKEEMVITLLSILEMCKNAEVTLSQNKNFSKIYVEVINE